MHISLNLLEPKKLIPIIAGLLLMACSAISCLGSVSIMVPRAADSLPTGVLVLAIMLTIIAPVLLLIGWSAVLYIAIVYQSEHKNSETEE